MLAHVHEAMNLLRELVEHARAIRGYLEDQAYTRELAAAERRNGARG